MPLYLFFFSLYNHRFTPRLRALLPSLIDSLPPLHVALPVALDCCVAAASLSMRGNGEASKRELNAARACCVNGACLRLVLVQYRGSRALLLLGGAVTDSRAAMIAG